MSQVPGLGHVTSYRHSTLFHSPLVGVDKETVATSTLGEKLEEEMNSCNTQGVCDLATLMVFMKISCRLCLLPLEVAEGAGSFSVRFRGCLVTLLDSLLLHLVMWLTRYSCLARCSCTCCLTRYSSLARCSCTC